VIGKVIPATTADVPSDRMKAITVIIAATITVIIAAPTARNATQPFALAVRLNVQIVVNQCATDVRRYAKNAKGDFVKIV
jgi:hypothetical protein